MTRSQSTALQQIKDLLDQHFDAWILGTRDTDENERAICNSFWKGSLDSVIGLTNIAQIRLSRVVIETTGPTEPFSKLQPPPETQ